MNAFHIHSKNAVTRHQKTTRLFCLSDADMPKGNGLPESLINIAKYLDPKNSVRYGGSKAFSYLYVYDFCYLAGCYLPIVWWGDANNPNDLKVSFKACNQYYWLQEEGKEFGWKEVETEKEACDLTEVGHVVIVAALSKREEGDGMISVSLPSALPHDTPIQSMAGTGTVVSPWYKGGLYKNYKMFVNFLNNGV